jgi:hypothetical protein
VRDWAASGVGPYGTRCSHVDRQTRRPPLGRLTLPAHPLAPGSSCSLTVDRLPPLTLALVRQEELDVPYEIKFYERDKDRRAPKELLKIHPLGKSPVITDGDVTLAESGAIIRAYLVFRSSIRLILCTYQEYIINKYGNGRVAPPKEGELIDLYCWRLLLLTSLTVADQGATSHPFCRGLIHASPGQQIYLFSGAHQGTLFPPPVTQACLCHSRCPSCRGHAESEPPTCVSALPYLEAVCITLILS